MYYGQYKSSTASITGCNAEFATAPREDSMFPPQVQYVCPACKINHSFRFMRHWLVNTPNQVKNFKKFCENHSIEQGISLANRPR